MSEISEGRYVNRILNLIAEKFRSSAQRSGGRKVRISGFEQYFPAIRTSADERIMFLESIEVLEKAGVISVKWVKFKKGDDVDAVYLENPNTLHELLGMVHPDEESRLIANAVDINEVKSLAAKSLVEYISSLVLEQKGLPFSSERDYRDVIRIIDTTYEERTSIPIRALSISLFSESKRIEELLPAIERLSAKLDIPEMATGLVRSYPECSIKGNVLIEFTDGNVWKLDGDIVTLSMGLITKIKKIIPDEGFNVALCSIENKETFYCIDGIGTFAGYIYCSGHVNAAVRTVIGKAYSSGNRISHFGDMDPDGILIFNEIDDICNGECTPFLMNSFIFEKYRDYGVDLSPQKIARLPDRAEKLMDVVRLILSTCKGVEQEIVKFDAK